MSTAATPVSSTRRNQDDSQPISPPRSILERKQTAGVFGILRNDVMQAHDPSGRIATVIRRNILYFYSDRGRLEPSTSVNSRLVHRSLPLVQRPIGLRPRTRRRHARCSSRWRHSLRRTLRASFWTPLQSCCVNALAVQERQRKGVYARVQPEQTNARSVRQCSWYTSKLQRAASCYGYYSTPS